MINIEKFRIIYMLHYFTLKIRYKMIKTVLVKKFLFNKKYIII